MRFSLEDGKSVILDAIQAKDDSPRILEMHAISFDRSKTLRSAPDQVCNFHDATYL